MAGDTVTRGHSLEICKLRANTREKANTLGVRVVNDWNASPKSVVKSESINISNVDLGMSGDIVWKWKYGPEIIIKSLISGRQLII